MKRVTTFGIIVLLLLLVVCACNESDKAENKAVISIVPTISPTSEPTPDVTPAPKSKDIGLTLEEMLEVIKEECEILNAFEVHDTADFTISRSRGGLCGCVCFSLPNEDNLCAVLFVCDKDWEAYTIYRKAAIGAQESLVAYCSENDIEVYDSVFLNDEDYVYAVIANGCGLDAESLPTSVQQYRTGEEFFSSEERVEDYKNYLKASDYEGLYEYMVEYSETEDAIVDAVFEEILDYASQCAELIQLCTVEYDPFEDESTIYYSGLTDVDRNNCFVPKLIASNKGRTDEKYKFGFISDGWLFFNKIVIVAGGEKESFGANVLLNGTTEILSGSTVYESYSSSSILSSITNAIIDAGEGAIRFEDTSEEKTLDHNLTEIEIAALQTLGQIHSINASLYYAPSSWAAM